MRKMVGKWMGCGAANCFTICCCNCPCARTMMVNNKKKGDNIVAKDIWKYLPVIEERLGENDYLAGDKLGILDLSLYGMTHGFS
jgi:glutathionyl-hydroquinone reductase